MPVTLNDEMVEAIARALDLGRPVNSRAQVANFYEQKRKDPIAEAVERGFIPPEAFTDFGRLANPLPLLPVSLDAFLEALKRVETLEADLTAQKNALGERIGALEKFASQMDRGVGEHKRDRPIAADVLHLFDWLGDVTKRLAKLEAYELDRDGPSYPVAKLRELEQKIEAAQCLAKVLHADKDAQLSRLGSDVQLLKATVRDLEQDKRNLWANLNELLVKVQARARVDAGDTKDREALVQRYVHGAGCQSEGYDVTTACPECEPVKGEPTRDDGGFWHPPLHTDVFGKVESVNATEERTQYLEDYGNVDACQRRYPLDPLTAEDPCEDCGRDQRKHDVPRETSFISGSNRHLLSDE